MCIMPHALAVALLAKPFLAWLAKPAMSSSRKVLALGHAFALLRRVFRWASFIWRLLLELVPKLLVALWLVLADIAIELVLWLVLVAWWPLGMPLWCVPLSSAEPQTQPHRQPR